MNRPSYPSSAVSAGPILASSEQAGSVSPKSNQTPGAEKSSQPTSPECRSLMMSAQSEYITCPEQTSSSADFPVKIYQSPANELDSQVSDRDSSLSLRESLVNFDPLGVSSRMFLDSFPQTRDEISQLFSTSWQNSGMAWRGEYLTASTSESPRGAEGCSLSGVLEERVHQRYFLSQRAAAGILRRAKKREKELPEALREALEMVSRGYSPEPEPSADPSSRPHTEKTDTPMPSTPAPHQSSSPRQSDSPRQVVTDAESQRMESSIPSMEQAGMQSVRPTPTAAFCAGAAKTAGSIGYREEQSPTLKGASGGNMVPAMHQADTVRRLTPTECERLQGFPDNWTIPTPPDIKPLEML